MSIKYRFGFSFIEIIIVMVIFAILAAMGFAGFRAVFQNARAVALSNDFLGSLNLARAEAIKRGSTVSVCPAQNANLLSCGNNGSWTNGWIVFNDSDNDGTINNLSERMNVQNALPAGATFTSNQAVITFNSAGAATRGAGNYQISASGCTGNNSRVISIANSGRFDVTESACP